MKSLRVIAELLVCFALFFPQLSAAQKSRMLIANGTAHVGNGTVIEKAAILVSGGKIARIGSAASLSIGSSEYDTLIDIGGKHVYPALINPDNVLGLHDAEAVRSTRDFAEVGRINPHVRALIAYNTDNLIIPTVKTNGVLYSQVTPRAGLISGSSSVMSLEGWNWEDAVLKADDGIHLNFPQMVQSRYSEEEDAVVRNANKAYREEMDLLEKFFSDARAYCSAKTAGEKNLRFEAMRGVMNGSARLYIHADKARDILSALSFVTRHSVKKPVIVGGRESWKVTADLRRLKVPVIVNRLNDLPERTDDDIDITFRVPAMLQRDSVLFCLEVEGDMEAAQSRNLPFNAGAAVAFGLTKEQALSAVTLNTAKIFGIDDMIGSLEAGKLASLVVSDGDLLDMRTNNVIFALLAGKPVRLDNQQKALYRKYLGKYHLEPR